MTIRALAPRRHWLLLPTLALLLAGCGPHASPSAPATTLPPVSPSTVGGEQALSMALLRQLSTAAGSGNVIVSPSSLEAVLSMLELGAEGQTEQQLAALLGASSVTPGVHAAQWHTLDATLAAAAAHSHVSLSQADAVWLQQGLPLTKAFTQSLLSDFAATPQAADFTTDPAAAIAAINHWVDMETRGQIPTLFGPDSIDTNTRVVLADAIYFQAAWATEFDASQTRSASFTTPTSSVTVPFMHQTTALATSLGEGVTAVQLPYTGGKFAALTLMPPATETLAQYTASLTPSRLAAVVNSLQSSETALAMPRFDLTETTTLNSTLEHMGMTDAFGPSCDLDGITSSEPLVVSLVSQRARLAVDEKGTTAAAATGVSVGIEAVVVPPPRSISVNHPFLMLVRNTTTGAILFTAAINDPA